jgi:sporulation integral membrane protein YtvI
LGFIGILPDLYSSLLAELGEVGMNLQGISERFPSQISEGIANLTNSLTESLGDLIGTIGAPTISAAGSVARNIPNVLVHVIFTIISAYFFIAERDRIVEAAHEHIPENIRKKWSFITEKFRKAVGGYFKAQFKIMGIVAVILFVGFLLLHIKYAVLVALLIAFLDFLPFFGTGTVLLPWALLKALSGDYRFAVGLIIIYLVSQLVRQVIQPKIVGDTMGLNPMVTLFFMYIGYKVSSIFGMIIAVPIGMIIVSLYQAGAFDDIITDVKELAEGINQLRKTPH